MFKYIYITDVRFIGCMSMNDVMTNSRLLTGVGFTTGSYLVIKLTPCRYLPETIRH